MSSVVAPAVHDDSENGHLSDAKPIMGIDSETDTSHAAAVVSNPESFRTDVCNPESSCSARDHSGCPEYEARAPITPHGLLIQLGWRAESVIFDGYGKQPDGSAGPAESQQIFRKRGDVVIAIEGTDIVGKSFREEVIPFVKGLIGENGREFVQLTVMDGSAWWSSKRRRDSSRTLRKSRSMALNEAYEVMEEMRKLNLEVELADSLSAGEKIDLHQCTSCLRSSLQSVQSRRRLDGRRVKKLLKKTQTSSCLICWAPVCPQHSCDNFRKEGITICGECSHLFSLDFIVNCVEADDHRGSKRRNDHLDRLVDIYDRVLLVLKFSLQFTDDIADSLERNVKRKHHIGLGSNVTGLVSGGLGVAAAAAILTPAGPPLLIASLLFGGTATAVSTGSEAVHHFSEPKKVADRIIALHGVASSLLRVTGVLRDALLRDHIRVDHYLEDVKEEPSSHGEQVQATLEQVKDTLENENVRIGQSATSATAKYVGAATEIGALAAGATRAEITGGVLVARQGRFFSRATSTAMRTARFARVFGGALSAATMVLEAKDMHSTVQQIRDGSPCEKAEMVRDIKVKVDVFPETDDIHKQCENYFAMMAKRQEEEERLARSSLYSEVEEAIFGEK